ncbi:hypothetical protein ACA910_018159 [Epithemia clementina (nom. ined.)]
MPPYGEPDWVTPASDTQASATQVSGTSAAPAATSVTATKDEGNSRRNARIFLVILSLINMCLAAAMGTLGVLTCINTTITLDELTDLFLGIYMTIFAAILFVYELCWWQPFPAINRSYRKNFGFMYGLNSKGFYLIFIAFLTIGLAGDNNSGVKGLDWISGLGWLAGGIIHVGAAMSWPETVEVYRPPTAGLASDNEDPQNVV